MSEDPIEGHFVEADAGQAVAVRDDHAIAAPRWNAEELATLKATIAKDTTDLEFDLFVSVARRQGLDPFARQIFAVKRGGQMTIQTSIDGFRLLAQRSGKLRGFRGPWWCGKDGEWREVWLASEPPEAAKVEVIHADYADPVAGIARWGAFVQTTSNGGPNSMWARMGDHMLAKCAEALALRRAFPAELSGIYTDDEMGQASNGGSSGAPGAQPRASLPETAQSAAPREQQRPTPPQPRPAPPRAGLPPANPPSAEPRYPWREELKAYAEEQGVTILMMAEFLGADASAGNIDAWLKGADGRTVKMLVDDAKALGGTNEAVEAGTVSPDEAPY